MKLLNAEADIEVIELLKKIFNAFLTRSEINRELLNRFGIADFLNSEDDYVSMKDALKRFHLQVASPNPVEYGDFQTPMTLSDSVCRYLKSKNIQPGVLIEPTCGKGNFILSSLKFLDSIDTIYGIEIFRSYLWECKFSIIYHYLTNPREKKPIIFLFNQNIFDFNLQEIERKLENREILVLGNPPWVTNSILGRLDSDNLPEKSNFKRLSGMDAITGKGNFDISEYITLLLLDRFSKYDGNMAFLVKSSVIKNIVFDMNRNRYKINNLEKLTINAGEEFNVSVDAALFYCRFNQEPSFKCVEKNFYISDKDSSRKTFGWIGDKFVADVEKYLDYKIFDGVSPFIWRSGLKHDCSQVLELKKTDNSFINKRGEKIQLEDDLIYEFLKSSDLQKPVITESSKYILLTQERVGQDTVYIEKNFPLSYRYLEKNEEYFLKRKSDIYKNKPRFSIFGIGDYSFKKFKVAISGLYKKPDFSLIIPDKSKPILLDDTCYFLGFDEPDDALYTFLLLRLRRIRDFIKSLVFLDMKRVYTKDILMRIALSKIAMNTAFAEIIGDSNILPAEKKDSISGKSWDLYLKKLSRLDRTPSQLSLFQE